MTETATFTLNEQQLELLCNAKTYLLLETFKEPTNPSTAAKKFGVPANRVHYPVKRSVAAGLLERVGETGRRRVYKTVATKFRFRKELLGPVTIALTAGGADLIKGLNRGFTSAFEQFFETSREEPGETDADYGILDLGTGQPPRVYQPLLGIAELRLSREDYAKVVRAMEDALHAAEKTNADERPKKVVPVNPVRSRSSFTRAGRFPTDQRGERSPDTARFKRLATRCPNNGMLTARRTH